MRKLTNLRTKQLLSKMREFQNQRILLDILKPVKGICSWWFTTHCLDPRYNSEIELSSHDGWLAFFNVRYQAKGVEQRLIYGITATYQMVRVYPVPDAPHRQVENVRPTLREVLDVNEIWATDYAPVRGARRSECFKIVPISKVLATYQDEFIKTQQWEEWENWKDVIGQATWCLAVSHEHSLGGESRLTGSYQVFPLDHKLRVCGRLIYKIVL